jgi:hypothetical protein
MVGPPLGPVTFLFTEIEGSTALWERNPTAMRIAVAPVDASADDCPRFARTALDEDAFALCLLRDTLGKPLPDETCTRSRRQTIRLAGVDQAANVPRTPPVS